MNFKKVKDIKTYMGWGDFLWYSARDWYNFVDINLEHVVAVKYTPKEIYYNENRQKEVKTFFGKKLVTERVAVNQGMKDLYEVKMSNGDVYQLDHNPLTEEQQ